MGGRSWAVDQLFAADRAVPVLAAPLVYALSALIAIPGASLAPDGSSQISTAECRRHRANVSVVPVVNELGFRPLSGAWTRLGPDLSLAVPAGFP